jgi:apoptosis-inducing factor 3
MGSHGAGDQGPDLTEGVTLAEFGGRQMLRGHVGKKAVLLARVGDDVLAVGATCTHYGGPLDSGIVVGDTVHCPLHHACFSLRTGEALAAPAFDPIGCWKVERSGDRIVVRETITPTPRPQSEHTDLPKRIVIVGGGAAGFACAEMLRRRGYEGSLTMLSEDADAPCDRPNLSKDYLAGEAPEDWIPLRSAKFYDEQAIDLHLNVAVTHIDTSARTVTTADGRAFAFERLLLATGAEPARPTIPGADQPHVFTLRSLADSRAIIERAKTARSVVVLGSSFIGLETAAALRARGLSVHVVSLANRPLEKVLGPELGDFIQSLHEDHGVTFHMKSSLASVDMQSVTLRNGTDIDADLVIMGIGVHPRVELAEAAKLAVGSGILVDEYLETPVPGIYAAGDAARWRDQRSGLTDRVEHWVVAERQGQVAAVNMLGGKTPFRDLPFFWSAHYDVTIRYVGHAQSWDNVEITGSLAARDCMVRYRKDGKVIAVATVGRDQVALEQAELLAGLT